MKLVITGATGTAGSEVVNQALLDPDVEKVLVLSRRPLSLKHPKLDVVLHEDYTNYSNVLPLMKGFDACLWCLGISQNAVGEKEYIEITYDYAMAAAKAMAPSKDGFVFCFLSGSGADIDEKSRFLFGRIKGRTEKDLMSLGRPKVYSFRPGYIHPGSKKLKLLIEKVFEPLTPLMYRFTPGKIISTQDLAKSMIRVAREGAGKTILDNSEIRRLARGGTV